jgi:hypothetical protein
LKKPKYCAYCRRININTRTIERPTDYVMNFSKYIHVCLSCIKEQGLEDIVEYKPTELQSFVDSMEKNAIVPSIISEDGKEYLAFVNGNGILLDTKQMKFIAEELLKTTQLSGLNDFIQEENQHSYFSMVYNQDNESEGHYLVPFENLSIKRKNFNPNKVWGCTCGNCSKKMSSKDGGDYFTITLMGNFKGPTERACSEGCMKVITKDIIMNWINDKKYQRYFNLENLDKRISDYFQIRL